MTTAMPEPVPRGSGPYHRPLTTHQAVVAELRRMIRQGDLRPGANIPQEALADRLSVSRLPVREALKVLEGEGQVEYVPHRGYFVAKLDLADFEEVQLLRDILEAEAIPRALDGITESDLEAMKALLLAMSDAGEDLGQLNAAHRDFHFRFLDAANLPRFLGILRQLWDRSEVYRAVYHGDEGSRVVSDSDHRAIFEAVVQKDVEVLATLCKEHHRHTLEGLRQSV